ncbi:hypothetical protein NT01EI_0762 [Edwardsiella ictaluri 93-146]|uniref:Uncharacterized protein n=1 Tax=Edwardsiella ictaluri (strain 93-146) TaxID=634503 RepID=C5B9I2_EDWI9|nr:hypothetical protein NT01EI_0762 [Edwardsiella ictaluri 93-146]
MASSPPGPQKAWHDTEKSPGVNAKQVIHVYLLYVFGQWKVILYAYVAFL